jgi:hypothetical protein
LGGPEAGTEYVYAAFSWGGVDFINVPNIFLILSLLTNAGNTWQF